MEILAWSCALGGIALGALGGLVPGFPGAAVALLGLAAYAGLTQFEVVGPRVLTACALLAVLSWLAQWAAPALTSRALRGAAGVATGAAVGAAFGAMLPIPALFLLTALLGAAAGALISRSEPLMARLRGLVGAGGGCLLAVAVDEIAVLAMASVLAAGDFWHTVQ